MNKSYILLLGAKPHKWNKNIFIG